MSTSVRRRRTSTLLVDPKLRKEYTTLYVEIDKAKIELLAAIKKQSKSRINFETEISSVFTRANNEFFIALVRIRKEIHDQKEAPFSEVHYNKIFDDNIVRALETNDLKSLIEEYIQRYNELLSSSTYFRKGTFDYYNASQIAKNLAANGFFKASHTVNLNAENTALEIRTQKELENVIAKEKKAIIKDAKLRKSFDAVANQLDKNAKLRSFKSYLMDNEALLSRLDNVGKFKEDVLKSYIKVHENLYWNLIEKYDDAQKRRKKIEEEARKQQTDWERVIEIFNDRFFVPFKLEARNRVAVMLGQSAAVDLAFTYRDGAETAEIERTDLLTVLSTGERKALYILNVIFEIERRKKDCQKTLVVIDDLADSFDYQNKYAIIQYLRDIGENDLFCQIIMTHNFDFFRTLESRFVGYSNCLMASRSDAGIALTEAAGIRNIFVNDWKRHFFDNSKKKIASIPFLRNLVEYTKGQEDGRYQQLTSMLHWKTDSADLTVGDLDSIFGDVCAPGGPSPDTAKPIFDLIDEQASACLQADVGMNFENKIVLAIAIRVTAERYMLGKIDDANFAASISSNQTQELIRKFAKEFSNETLVVGTLNRVALMTPENIHLNSFMYEPIVDMSDDHLKKLYMEVTQLA